MRSDGVGARAFPRQNHTQAWPFQYLDAPVPAGLGYHPGGGPPGTVLRLEGKQATMTRPSRPSRAPSKSPTLIGMFFKCAIRALAAAQNSQKTMTGPRTMAGLFQSLHDRILCLTPVRGNKYPHMLQVVLSELVQTTAGKWITHPPTRCPNGHSLGPGEVLLGHQVCLVHGGGHTTWSCRTCDPDRARATAQRPLHVPRRASDRAHLHQTCLGVTEGRQ